MAIYNSRPQIGFTVVVAIIYLTMGLTQIAFNPERLLTIIWLISGVVFFSHVTWTLMRDIFASQGNITSDLLYGTVSVYLLIGLSFANGHFLLEKAIPGSYHCGSPQCIPFQTMSAYVYFSFITLATVGYGDITPSSGIAGVMTYMEAITTGQMYLAILVTRLVGMQISQSRR
ncbi:ion channel [Methylobacter psychrophilus]|uniref:ion channel n=1 Tax=Methylobacter psychrophilus TaxID=96941 RepID=UPI0021D49852|nr:ion channel [Methylobacter psychrophilus]